MRVRGNADWRESVSFAGSYPPDATPFRSTHRRFQMKLLVYGEGESDQARLRLVRAGDFIRVVVVNQEGYTVDRGVLVQFRPDGTMGRLSGVGWNLGFRLDSEGKIKLED